MKTVKSQKAHGVFLLRAGAALAALFLLFVLPLSSHADFGDFSGDTDYGSDWDSDWGSDDWDSGWSSDDDWSWGSDYDNDSSYSYSSGDSSGSFDFLYTVIGVLAGLGFPVAGVIWIVLTLIRMFGGGNKGGRATPARRPAGAERTSNLRSLEEYKTLDPQFDEAQFRERMANLYLMMQEEWHKKNIESLRPYFTDAFYNQSLRQIEQKVRDKQTPCTERVAVLEVTPRGFYQSGGMDHMVVKLRSRLIAYILDDETGKVISGDQNREKFMEYEWDLCRKTGTITEAAPEVRSITCPHCAAALDINQTTVCPYCGSVVTVINEDWALNHIKGISQQTA